MAAVLLGVLFLLPATVAAAYYAGLTLAGSRVRRLAGEDASAWCSFAVLIPAHNEELSLVRVIRSVKSADYPEGLVRVLVVADNCTDQTADIARALRAEVLERYDPELRGKGHALAFGMRYALDTKADAVLILDADCELSRSCLKELDAALSAGAEAAQAAVVLRNPDAGPTGLVAAAGAVIDNAVDAGRSRLGRPVTLRGTGMAFRRTLLERHPWRSFGLTEDAEYTEVLERAGVRVRFVPSAVVVNEAPAGVGALTGQRRRWRAALKVGGAGLVSRWLGSKPLVLAQLAVAVLTVAALAAWMPWPWAVGLLGWSAVLVGLTGWVYLRAVRLIGGRTDGVRGMVAAAAVVARLGWVTVCGLFARRREWERTQRPIEASQTPA